MQPVAGIYHKLSLLLCFIIIVVTYLLHATIRIPHVQASLLFSSYTFVCLIAAAVNQDVDLLKNSIQLFVMYVAIGIFLPTLVGAQLKNILLNGILIAYLPFLILCFQRQHMVYGAFAGVFENPNTLGFSMIALIVVVLLRLYDMTKAFLMGQRLAIITFVLYIGIYLIGVYVILLSNARTSLLTVFVLTMVTIIALWVHSKMAFLPSLKFIFLLLSVGCFLGLMMLENTSMQQAWQSIMLKMERKSADMMDGRLEIWHYVWQHVRFWGHGTAALWEIGVAHAHNTFFNIIHEAGVLAVICYSVFLLCIVQANRQLFIVLVVLAAFCVSTFEILYFNVLHLLIFIVSGVRERGKAS
ncbi:hypothetical protein LYSBPC_04480 [Lysinibacillus piscis]|uniref:O-antigen ligase-related domain-containing protein n=2 Tax=Lysinibacillus piscis TaxID=2518931 RepID=A0ABQ5NGY3_9BACI|nr:hypothetical protein LYSBPC_04480 [Lysinibacillus sp. KH24]